jgi:hypothetical protein
MLGKAVLGGFALGAVGLGTASYLSADGSDLFFSPEEQAMMGAFVGAWGGALAGLLFWAVAVAAERVHRLLRRTWNGFQ